MRALLDGFGKANMSHPSAKDRANAIRFLSIDAVQKAKSGHPGMPMGMADIAEVLWHDFLQHYPSNPHWPNRDRFILSNGHGSMLQYALLHLTGYDLSIDDLKQFRQLHSKTPGHPEYREAPGIETTTGPLGQGFANAVGMAIAEKHMAAQFNRPDFPIVDHYTYCFVGDGCLMEGISHEAASLAGIFKLNKLIVFYDDNGISIDGEVKSWFHDDTAKRFEAYGWHVIDHVNGHERDAIYNAITNARNEAHRPTLIICKTTIGFGSPHAAGKASAHGAPLGESEIALVREALEWPYPPFEVPQLIYDSWNAKGKGAEREGIWDDLFKAYQAAYPVLAVEFTRRLQGAMPDEWEQDALNLLKDLNTSDKPVATRKASEWCLDYVAPLLPEIMGGSADLTESNCTLAKGMQVFSDANPEGTYIHYGVREFGMSAIMNGLALHGGIIPYGGTFLTFSDYARNAVRLAALMKQRVIFVYSHDSIGLGEDGPTHQPIEHLPSLRMMPNLSVWRPCDAVETAIAWRFALEHLGPTCLLLSRQALPKEAHHEQQFEHIARGGYILWEAKHGEPDIIFIATGSEVQLVREAAQRLATEGVNTRVVSMPSVDVFLTQSPAYQEEVLPSRIEARVVVEAAVGIDWYRFVSKAGCILGIDRYGASAPAADAYKAFGFTVQHVLDAAKNIMKQSLAKERRAV